MYVKYRSSGWLDGSFRLLHHPVMIVIKEPPNHVIQFTHASIHHRHRNPRLFWEKAKDLLNRWVVIMVVSAALLLGADVQYTTVTWYEVDAWIRPLSARILELVAQFKYPLSVVSMNCLYCIFNTDCRKVSVAKICCLNPIWNRRTFGFFLA